MARKAKLGRIHKFIFSILEIIVRKTGRDGRKTCFNTGGTV